MKSIHLKDWMTTPEMRVGLTITDDASDAVYHSHDFYEIFYVIEGSILHILNGEKQPLQHGDILLLRPSDVHCFRRSPGKHCAHRDIVIDSKQFRESCDYIDTDFFKYVAHLPSPLKTTISLEQIQHFENDINRILSMNNKQSKVKQSSLINVLMSELLGVFLKAESSEVVKMPGWMGKLLSRFHMNDYLKDGLDRILEDVNMNMSYICRTFKKLTGVTMSEYLCQIRLKYAANLLQFTDSTVASICTDVGFSSVAYFNTKFKNFFGCSPKVFRKTSRM